MKYLVIAKILGSYMPEKRAKIGDCIIAKSYDQYHLDDDRPAIPVRSKDTEFHCLEKGVRNYVYYPQELISIRTFESEYIITTEIDKLNEYDALKIAGERFSDVSSALSLVAKNKAVHINGKRVKRGDEIYDFEIIGIFLKKNKHFIRLKLPRPLINGRNFFPKQFPKNFLNQAKKFTKFQDTVFKKGLIYFQRATAMRHSGVFNDLEIILNFVKCIELISWYVGRDDYLGLSKKKFQNLSEKKIIEGAGKKIGVTQKSIKKAKRAWDVRNTGDVAHKDLYYNPYSRRSTNTFLNLSEMESCVAEFLTKYFKYREKNLCRNFIYEIQTNMKVVDL